MLIFIGNILLNCGFYDIGDFYGLEYVLDELIQERPTPENQQAVDWFGTTDFLLKSLLNEIRF